LREKNGMWTDNEGCSVGRKETEVSELHLDDWSRHLLNDYEIFCVGSCLFMAMSVLRIVG